MKLNVKVSVALVALVASMFGLASKSFAQDATNTDASSVIKDQDIDVKSGSNSNATPAAAAAIFSVDATGNVNEAAVAASVGSKGAGAAVIKYSETEVSSEGVKTTITQDAATALGSDSTLDLKLDAFLGTVDFTKSQTTGQ